MPYCLDYEIHPTEQKDKYIDEIGHVGFLQSWYEVITSDKESLMINA